MISKTCFNCGRYNRVCNGKNFNNKYCLFRRGHHKKNQIFQFDSIQDLLKQNFIQDYKLENMDETYLKCHEGLFKHFIISDFYENCKLLRVIYENSSWVIGYISWQGDLDLPMESDLLGGETMIINANRTPNKDEIPYSDIDVELREVIKLLNEKGFKTQFCCYGHKEKEVAKILFDPEVEECKLAKLIYNLKDKQFQGRKWLRYSEYHDSVWSNWILEYPKGITYRDADVHDGIKASLTNRLIEFLRRM